MSTHDDNIQQAFEAGFDQQTPDATTSPQPAPEPVESVTEAQAQEIRYAAITEEQYNALLEKTAEIDRIKAENKRLFDSAFGKLGGLAQAFAEEKKKKSSETDAAQEIDISLDDFKELSEEYPDLAQMHIDGLKKTLSKLKLAGGAPDPQQIENVVQARLELVKHDLQKEALAEDHEDWEEVIRHEKFAEWKTSLSEKEREKLDSTWNAKYISKKLTEFKEYIAPQVQTDTKPAIDPKKASRQKLLQASVAPKGVGGHAPATVSEYDAFLAGFDEG